MLACPRRGESHAGVGNGLVTGSSPAASRTSPTPSRRAASRHSRDRRFPKARPALEARGSQPSAGILMSCEGGLAAHPLRAEGPSLIIVASVAFGFIFESPIMAAIKRERLPHRRLSETFDFEFAGYTCTARWFRDGRIAEIFLSSHKSNSVADTAVTDAAIVASIALQFGANVETIRRALCRDSRGHASGPLGAALDELERG